MSEQVGARQPTTDEEELAVRRLVAARNVPRGLWQRAQIITMSWDGATIGEIARETGLHPRTVRYWFGRFATSGVSGLTDRPRSGRPPLVDEHQRTWLIRTASRPPDVADRPQWTLSTLVEAAHEAGITISRSQLRRILRDAGVTWSGYSRTNGTAYR